MALTVTGMGVVTARTLSFDYLIKVHSIVHGGRTSSQVRRSPVGALVGRISGGQVSRAGFDFVRKMMLREWEFIQRALRLVPIPIGGTILLMTGASPFAGRFSAIHAAPHVIGLGFFLLAYLLPYGSEYKAVWIFMLVSGRSFKPFVRGIYLAFWLPFVLLPNLAGLIYRAWTWSPLEAVAFYGFSTALMSLYLGVELRRVDGIPFMKPSSGITGDTGAFLAIIVRIIVTIVVIAIQYFVLSISPMIMLAAAVILGVGAYAVVRGSLQTLETSIRFQLSNLSTGSTMLYKEVD